MVEERLGRSTLKPPSAAERLQVAFALLTGEQQEALLDQAIAWARTQTPEIPVGEKQPEPSRDELTRRFPSLGGQRVG